MTGNDSLDTALVGILTLASAAAIGIFIYTEMVFEKPLPDNETAMEELLGQSKKQIFSDYFKIDQLIINLPTQKSGRLRFLTIKTHIKPFKNDYLDLLEKEKAFIHDTVIDVVGNMSPGELNSLYGKIMLDGRIKKRINSHLGRPIVEAIYFSKFTVQ